MEWFDILINLKDYNLAIIGVVKTYLLDNKFLGEQRHVSCNNKKCLSVRSFHCRVDATKRAFIQKLITNDFASTKLFIFARCVCHNYYLIENITYCFNNP